MARRQSRKPNTKRRPPAPAKKEETPPRFWHDPRFVIPTLIAIVSLTFNAISEYPAFIDYLTRNNVQYRTSAETVWDAEVQPLDYNPFLNEKYRPGWFSRTVQLWVKITVENTGNRDIKVEDLTRGMMLIPEWGNPTIYMDMLLRESGDLEEELEFTLPFYTYKIYNRPLLDVANEIRLPIPVASDQTLVIYTPFTVPLSKNFPLMFNKQTMYGPQRYLSTDTVSADLLLSYNNFGEPEKWRQPGEVIRALGRKEDFITIEYSEPLPDPDFFESLYPKYESPLWVKIKFSDNEETKKFIVHLQDPECSSHLCK